MGSARHHSGSRSGARRSREFTRVTPQTASATIATSGSRSAAGAGVRCGRRNAAATRKATRENAAEVRNAARTPGTNSPGTAPAAYTDTIAATPTAPPSCCVVCSRPEADAGVLGLDAAQHRRGDRHEDEAGGQARDQHRAEDRPEVAVGRAMPLSQA